MAQAQLVREYKKELSDAGVFYAEYDATGDLTEQLQEHLSSLIQDRLVAEGEFALDRWDRPRISIFHWLRLQYKDLSFMEAIPEFYILEDASSGGRKLGFEIIDMSAQTAIEVLSGRHFTHIILDDIIESWEDLHPDEPISNLTIVTIGPPDREVTQRYADAVQGYIGDYVGPALIFGYLETEGTFVEVARFGAAA